MAHATKRITPNTDAIVKDSTVRVLTNDDARVVLSDFSIVNQAGKAGAFSADNAGYASAVKTVDGYIGEIMNALKARKSFSKEDWLVVITSDHGGVQNTYGGPSAIERNIFSLFYHPKYSPLELNGTLFNTVNFNANVKVSLPDPNGLYGIGDGSITVEGKMKINAGSDGTYNAGSGYYKLIGKSKWGIYRQRTALSLRFTDDGGVATQIDPSNTFIDGNWHTFDCVIGTTFSNGIRSHTAKVYVDGALVSNSTNLSQVSTITDATPLLIGGASGVDFNLKDIRIWNKVLTDVEIANNACSQAAKPTDLEYSSLIGLWPGEDNGPVFKSALTGKPDIPLTGPYQYTVSANSLPCDLGASNFTVENISIAREVFFWLNVPLQSSWGLDGREFLTKFDTELLK